MGTGYSGYGASSSGNAKHTQPQQQGGTTTTQPNSQPRMSRTDTVSVEIRGKRLAIRTDHDPVYVHQIANYLDTKLRDLQAQAPSAAFEKLLMLASMTIIEELFDARADMAHLRRDVATKTSALIELLDQESAHTSES
jgi:cell division protein ZapA (FtsZ GTPase activity inhibitor)